MPSVDYRMARRATLRALKKGMVSQLDVCDAHPDLLRAANNLGEHTGDVCPVCDRCDLRLVLYTYGHGRRRSEGWPRRREDLHALQQQVEEFRCYVVEVCTGCSWNHLVRSFWAGRRHAAGASA